MRVLLVMPPLFRFGGVIWPHFHLGLGYIAAALRQEGHEAWIYDANNATEDEPNYPQEELFARYSAGLNNVDGHPVWREFTRVLSEFQPQVVGISVRSVDAPSGLICADLVKRWNSSTTVLMGGIAATATPQQFLTNSVDLVVRGEGEGITKEVIARLASGTDPHLCDGITWMRGGNIIHNPNRHLIDDLDRLPFPAREALLFSNRLSRGRLTKMMGDLITSRGCPHKCTFCANNVLWGNYRVRVRSSEAVVREMELLRDKFGVTECVLWDDHFTENRRRVLEICGEIRQRSLGLKWITFARATSIDVELVRALRSAGCCQLQIGVESGSERILKQTRKGVTLGDVRRAARVLREEGMEWLAFLMIGFPGETRGEMMATMDLVDELQPDRVAVSVVTPYPGTELYSQAIARSSPDVATSNLADSFNPDSCLVTTMSREEFKNVALSCFHRADDYNWRKALATRMSTWERLQGQIASALRSYSPPAVWSAMRWLRHCGRLPEK
jgi:radical SAM superfamily enzyme YgiQ (UPF0313 family)